MAHSLSDSKFLDTLAVGKKNHLSMSIQDLALPVMSALKIVCIFLLAQGLIKEKICHTQANLFKIR